MTKEKEGIELLDDMLSALVELLEKKGVFEVWRMGKEDYGENKGENEKVGRF